MAGMHVITPGLLTTVQDRGRWGWQSVGVSVSGAMDPRALRLSNAMVGNGADAAALEVTLEGPEVEFEDERRVAVCGAEFSLSIGGRVLPPAEPFAVHAGERLRFGSRGRGARAYLAVTGGFAVPPVFGSRATHVASGIGGHEGRALRSGDWVPLGLPARVGAHLGTRAKRLDLMLPDRYAHLRVVLGPQADRFSQGTLAQLTAGRYTVSINSDRIGYRLEGSTIDAAANWEPLSSPTVIGALQVPPDGRPILLMADRQSIGGYRTIATVIGADIGVAGQLAPGDSVSFDICSRKEALTALIAQERALMSCESP